ncbi:MAG TPA: hypothetical protein VKX31_00440 [Brumimicrobium sp.]|nr:hypothetical protein [Brumimicrobium sp.]
MAQKENSTDVSKQMNGGFWGSLVNTVGNLADGFNYKAQENQIELARLEAERASAEASTFEAPGIGPVEKKYAYIAGGAVVLIILFFILKK